MKNMINSKNRFYQLVGIPLNYIKQNTIFVFIAIIYFLFLTANQFSYWATSPFPNDLREGAGLHTASLFAQGLNPLSTSAPNNSFYMYGFVFPLLVGWYEMLIGYSGYFPLRLFALFGILASAGMVESFVRRIPGNVFPNWLGFCLMIPAGWIGMELLGRPDALALAFVLGSIAAFAYGKSVFSVAASAVLMFAAFHTKQYFVLYCIPMFFGGLFISLRRSVLLTAFCTVLLIPTFPLIAHIFPFYLPMSFLTFGESLMSYVHLMFQVKDFSKIYWPLIVMVLYGWFFLFHNCRWRSEWHFQSDAPLFSLVPTGDSKDSSLTLFWSTILILNSAMLLWLGQNAGASRSYFLQLSLPALVVCSAYFFSAMQGSPFGGKWFLIIVAIVCVVYPARNNFFTKPLTVSEQNNWFECEEMLSNADGEILIQAPLFVDLALRKKLKHFQNGLFGIEWLLKSYRKLSNSGSRVSEMLFFTTPDLISRCESFLAECDQKIVDRKFSMAAMCFPSQRELELLKESGYWKVKSFELNSGGAIWPVEIWKRN